jgi:hypothetical protein
MERGGGGGAKTKNRLVGKFFNWNLSQEEQEAPFQRLTKHFELA